MSASNFQVVDNAFIKITQHTLSTFAETETESSVLYHRLKVLSVVTVSNISFCCTGILFCRRPRRRMGSLEYRM